MQLSYYSMQLIREIKIYLQLIDRNGKNTFGRFPIVFFSKSVFLREVL